MNNDFKRASYLTTILLFIIGILALVAISAAKFFEFDELVVTVSELVSLVAFSLCLSPAFTARAATITPA